MHAGRNGLPIQRICLANGLRQYLHCIVRKRRIRTHLAAQMRFVDFLKMLPLGALIRRLSRLQNDRAVASRAGLLQKQRRDDSADTDQGYVKIKATHFTHQLCGLNIDATKNDNIRLTLFDRAQYGIEVRGVIADTELIDDIALQSLGRIHELFHKTVSEWRLIIDDGDTFGLHLTNDIVSGISSADVVMRHDAISRRKTLLRISMRSGALSNLHQPGVAIDARSWNADTGIPVTDHSDHLAFDKILRHQQPGARIRTIVLDQQLEYQPITVKVNGLQIEIINGNLCGLHQSRSGSGRNATQWCCIADENRPIECFGKWWKNDCQQR